GHGLQVGPVARVVLVGVVDRDTGGCNYGQKCALDLNTLQRAQQVVYITLHHRFADVLDGCDANVPTVLPSWRTDGSPVIRIARLIFAAHANLRRLRTTHFVPAQPVHDVGEPAGLAELAVADHVDAGFDLFADDLGNGT